MRAALLGFIAWGWFGSPAFAQVGQPALEIGIGLSGVAAGTDIGDLGAPSQPLLLTLRATAALSHRFSLEGTVAYPRAPEPHYHPVSYYTIQVKQRLVRSIRADSHAFLTYGFIGAYSATAAGPLVPEVIGVGVQRQLGRHFTLRADAQVVAYVFVPLGARFAADLGIGLPIGHR